MAISDCKGHVPSNVEIQQKADGFIPSPEALARYNAILAALPERLIKIKERELLHCRSQENKILARLKRRHRGARFRSRRVKAC